MSTMKEKNGVFTLAARVSDLGTDPTSSAVTARGTWYADGASASAPLLEQHVHQTLSLRPDAAFCNGQTCQIFSLWTFNTSNTVLEWPCTFRWLLSLRR